VARWDASWLDAPLGPWFKFRWCQVLNFINFPPHFRLLRVAYGRGLYLRQLSFVLVLDWLRAEMLPPRIDFTDAGDKKCMRSHIGGDAVGCEVFGSLQLTVGPGSITVLSVQYSFYSSVHFL